MHWHMNPDIRRTVHVWFNHSLILQGVNMLTETSCEMWRVCEIQARHSRWGCALHPPGNTVRQMGDISQSRNKRWKPIGRCVIMLTSHFPLWHPLILSFASCCFGFSNWILGWFNVRITKMLQITTFWCWFSGKGHKQKVSSDSLL